MCMYMALKNAYTIVLNKIASEFLDAESSQLFAIFRLTLRIQTQNPILKFEPDPLQPCFHARKLLCTRQHRRSNASAAEAVGWRSAPDQISRGGEREGEIEWAPCLGVSITDRGDVMFSTSKFEIMRS